MGLLFRVLIFMDRNIVMSDGKLNDPALAPKIQLEQLEHTPSGSSWVVWHVRRSARVPCWLVEVRGHE